MHIHLVYLVMWFESNQSGVLKEVQYMALLLTSLRWGQANVQDELGGIQRIGEGV